MDGYTLGDLVLIEIALVQFFKDVDINMEAGQQVSGIIGKTEIQIGQLKAAAINQGGPDLNPPPTLNPQA